MARKINRKEIERGRGKIEEEERETERWVERERETASRGRVIVAGLAVGASLGLAGGSCGSMWLHFSHMVMNEYAFGCIWLKSSHIDPATW